MGSLDQILGGGEAVSEGKTEEQVTQAVEAFKDAEDQTEQTEGQSTEGDGGGNHIPVAALQAERAKVKRYTEQVADFEKKMGSVHEQNATLTRQVTELLQRIPQQRQEQPAVPDFFDNPQAATQHEVRQTVSPEFDRINQSLLAFAKDNAITRFTEEKVNEAEGAFINAMQNRTLEQSDYQRVISSPNRYAEAVKWHQRQTAQAEIGDDPAAYRERVRAEEKAAALAEINGGGQQQQVDPAAQVRPSNLAGARNVGARTGPAWSGPASLNDIFSRRQSG